MEQQYFVNIIQIIDASTERGAWKGSEIEAIALLRKQTMEQINAMAEPQKEDKEENVVPVRKKIGES
tara:strand:- start:38 stop:238 length:201 start_codon:yes stop_codon:yes gene_type:complete